MADDSPTQKEISATYQRHLRYFRPRHYLRRWHLWMLVGGTLVSVLAVTSFRKWGQDTAFSPGPISENHASLGRGCLECHPSAEISVFARLPSLKVADGSLQTMNQNCLGCHPGKDLHLPQASHLAMRPVSEAVTLVRTGACATCHREHAGAGPLGVPGREACLDCHNNADRLRLTAERMDGGGATIASEGNTRDLGDGLLRFLAPVRPYRTLSPSAHFADRHPPFGYEDPARHDPATIKFNHARHLRGDLPKLAGGKELSCAFCHEPGPGGTSHRSVDYERHCQECHTLQIHRDLPDLLVPHGDPEKVRYFLRSLPGMLDSEQWKFFEDRKWRSLPEFEKVVYEVGDPPKIDPLASSRRGSSKFVTECAKCHAVDRRDVTALPKVATPNIAERWMHRSTFPHNAHLHVDCRDCHAKALTSKDTKDILLPPQTLCAECHRPTTRGAPLATDKPSQLTVSFDSDDSESLAARQVKIGGIKSDCQGCHFFHAPPNAASLLEALMKPKGPAASDSAPAR